MTGDESVSLARLRWRCRRGMRELDVLLLAFLEGGWTASTPAEQEAFGRLLELPDPRILDLLAGRETADDAASHAVVQRILQYSRTVAS